MLYNMFASLDTSLHSIDPVIFEYILCVLSFVSSMSSREIGNISWILLLNTYFYVNWCI